ncbi:MAG: glycoside hydrolase [Bryobacteraceae bacterium]|nr:glycoside hydrolase [Bryobacteraceae bacterium]
MGTTATRRALLIAIACLSALPGTAAGPLDWPAQSAQTKPWSYWWWMASAVDQANITRELETYQRAGWGGLHIIPIYGAKGYESRYIDYLSPKWMSMMSHSASEARRLGMDIDMTLGSGWCFGGPNITRENANVIAVPKQTPDGWQVGVRESMRVKRAAPGGEGWMLNPLSRDAITAYLERFTAAFSSHSGALPRAVYHDSFEYNANWSANLLAEFQRRRSYRLEDHYDALFGNLNDDRTARVKADYRATLSDLVTDEFTAVWTSWARGRRILTRNQAHGSPANLLDLYALADIPETEMFRHDRSTLISKLASSAAHIEGRRQVASETGTWMKEHFQERLSDMKELIQQLFVAGVNHVVYHGSAYSPADAPWPGWLFYASTEMNWRNPIFRDAPALNAWISRSQAMLQNGRSDNDLLLYWPVHDVWHDPKGLEMKFTVHSRDWLTDQPFGRFAQSLYDRGWTFDFISDRLLEKIKADGRTLRAPGAEFRAILVPPTQYMPVETFSRLLDLAYAGTTVIFADALPADVPGFGDLESRRAQYTALRERLNFDTAIPSGARLATVGQGRVLVGPAEAALSGAGIKREPLVDNKGLEFIRRIDGQAREYFIANRSAQPLSSWVPLAHPAASIVLMDPMTGATGLAVSRTSGGESSVYLQLEPNQSVFVRLLADKLPVRNVRSTETASGKSVVVSVPVDSVTGVKPPAAAPWVYRKPSVKAVPIEGRWTVEFLEGGPEVPPTKEIARPDSWTRFAGPVGGRFAGTARYSILFDAPAGAWFIDLGEVRESARVRLNGKDLGTLIEPPFRIHAGRLRRRFNLLEVEVTSLAANRIRHMDREHRPWRVFHDINLVNSDYKPFDASNWPVFDSGLLGPVTLRQAAAVKP